MICALTAFLFWGGWVCGTERPGHGYTYTQNWPYDPAAGNEATRATLLWSVAGIFVLILVLGAVLFAHGRAGKAAGFQPPAGLQPPLGQAAAAAFRPTPSRRAAYKFFVAAAALFILQVVGGILAIHDFVGFATFFGVDISTWLPVTVTRGWHLTLAVLWITACWMGGSIFILPLIAKREVDGQVILVHIFFAVVLAVSSGSLLGIHLGPSGFLGPHWAPARKSRLGVHGTRKALAVAAPRTNFAIADFWRWMVIHMWAECFLEVFTAVVVAYFFVLMGLASEAGAARTVYLATLLFLGAGIVGISHNFYWSAKPDATLALGSVFSTLQVVPLVLLAAEAWKVYRMPADRLAGLGRHGAGRNAAFAQGGAFLFLLGVNFWNFLEAGVFGLIINLPIVNYNEH